MALNALEIKNFSCPPDRNQIKKFDANGLFLLIKKNNSKLWRFRYRYAGKHQEMSLGKYPTVSLHEARKLANEARVLLVQGVNPLQERKEQKNASNPQDMAFEVIALKWWKHNKDSWSPDHAARIKRWIIQDAQMIGGLAIDQIDAGHITELMLAREAAGTPKKAPVILSIINRIFGYALAHRLTRSNPAQGLTCVISTQSHSSWAMRCICVLFMEVKQKMTESIRSRSPRSSVEETFLWPMSIPVKCVLLEIYYVAEPNWFAMVLILKHM